MPQLFPCRIPALAITFATILSGACGSGAGDDGGTDAPADAGRGDPVRVLVELDGAPLYAIDVVFHDADGAVLAHERTGMDGLAETTEPGATMATVLHRVLREEFGVGHSLFTYTDLLPGQLATYSLHAEPSLLGDRVELVPPEPLADATSYLSTEGCVLSHTEVLETFINAVPAPGCATDDGRWSFLAAGLDAASEEVAYTYLIDQAPGTSGATTLLDWTRDVRAVSFALTNVPATFHNVISVLPLPAWRDILYPLQGVSQDLSGADVVLVGRYPAGFGDAAEYRVRVGSFETGASVSGDVPTGATAVDLDLVEDFLPMLETATFERGSRRVSWSSGVSTGAPDLARVELGEPAVGYFWVMVADPTSSSLQFPSLPPGLTDWDLPPDAALPSGGLFYTVALLDPPGHDGWEDVKLHAGEVSRTPNLPAPARMSWIVGAPR